MNRAGIIVIDKPAGCSSFKVVQTVKNILGVKRAGHTGTLDPFATGVLPVCVNEATKAIQFLSEDEKEYEGVLVLGTATDTFDVTGKIVTTSADVPNITFSELQQVFAEFAGVVKQVPPLFSAVKFKGKPLYHWARRGVFVEKEARKVTIKELTVEKAAFPEVSFKVVCSKGTYVRSLVHDIGQRIGCGAYLKELRRLRSGPFTIEQAIAIEAVEDKYLLPVSDALGYLPGVEVDEPQAKEVQQGRELFLEKTEVASGCRKTGRPWVRIISRYGDLLAIYTWRDNSGNLKPVRVFKRL
jgi:tRNA pseudouridine55 synthase